LSFRNVEDLSAERGIGVSYKDDSALGESFRVDDRGGFAQASPQALHDIAPV
jgi:hypothetical protein